MSTVQSTESTEVAKKIAKKRLRQVANVRELLWNNEAREQLAMVAAKHMRPERMMRLMANALNTTPQLEECEPLTLLGALMTCAGLGLEPNTPLGHAYLIPFKNRRKNITEVQLVVGYKGLIDLARRSGHITSIMANVHYSDDELWEYEEGIDAKLRHRPGPQEGEKQHAYAIARFREDMGGGYAHMVLPWSHVMKIRNQSQGWQSAIRFNKTDQSPWSTHEDAMAKKTAIRALAKYLPLSTEFRDAVQMDADAGSHVDFAAFAMDPKQGVTIDGTLTEDLSADGDQGAGQGGIEAASEETPPAEQKPAQRASRRAQAAAGPEPEPESGIPDEYQSLVTRVVNDLGEAKSADDVEETMSMWADAVDPLSNTCPAAFEQIQVAASEARQRVAP